MQRNRLASALARILPTSLLLAGGAACCLPASAAISDTISPFISTSYSYDDNLFRIDDKAPGFDGQRSDTSRQVQAGFLINRPIGRQLLTGQVKWSRVYFDHFDQLDYTGKDYLADLEWHIANHLEGHVGASYSQTLTPFSDLQSSDRNLRTIRREYVNGGWRFHPSWRVRGGFSRDKYTYDSIVQKISDRQEDATELGLDYLPASNSRIGIQLRHLKGTYPNRANLAAFGIEQGYEQDEVKANIYWRFSGVTQVQLLGGWVKRKNDLFSGRDSSGANGRVTVYWAPLGKVRFTGSVWHEFAAVENSLITSSLNNGASLAAAWDISAKVRMDAQVRREKRDFSAASGLVLPNDVSDTTRTSSIGLTYAPRPNIQLGINAFQDTRKGAPIINTGSYRAKGASLSASIQF
ncbi:XrtB/PEP-CTERM-associated polysaccharide biosynthesis outer membrane protein EpsL [Janthinobacterium sp.]|uniref:XrtB/PEP-CTERM-associated polysaccharide biosynthesis outer membrane protein EpsL n=1 Tax=unclassified Janthinobacterium TaxID=2610881 RepID=UPI002DBDCF95|nr:XrtB/PEP-CTERM-associated polysaccharide biosynthesis outer membrane protein EpsL [Janthinobacterium sp.]HEU4816213.1 XrtB/PEP-CTERM-associated polysaccharide biosynthesis outer membrane protein EpsL [Janthinobacterium sp.]